MGLELLIGVVIGNTMKIYLIEGSEAKLLAEVKGDTEEEYYCVKFGVI